MQRNDKAQRQGLAQGPLTTWPLAETFHLGLSPRPAGDEGHSSLGFHAHFCITPFMVNTLGSAISSISLLPPRQKELS